MTFVRANTKECHEGVSPWHTQGCLELDLRQRQRRWERRIEQHQRAKTSRLTTRETKVADSGWPKSRPRCPLAPAGSGKAAPTTAATSSANNWQN